VNTNLNPADVASRGLNLTRDTPAKFRLWLEGPTSLLQNADDPKSEYDTGIQAMENAQVFHLQNRTVETTSDHNGFFKRVIVNSDDLRDGDFASMEDDIGEEDWEDEMTEEFEFQALADCSSVDIDETAINAKSMDHNESPENEISGQGQERSVDMLSHPDKHGDPDGILENEIQLSPDAQPFLPNENEAPGQEGNYKDVEENNPNTYLNLVDRFTNIFKSEVIELLLGPRGGDPTVVDQVESTLRKLELETEPYRQHDNNN
jgi:hypothetical protein